jgi:chromosome partitioning protein
VRTILVINSKGGCGKTTVTTNLASYYASTGLKVAVMDYDPQGSSLEWLKQRPDNLPKIHGANAVRQAGQPLRSLHMWVPDETDLLFLDAPGGINGILLQEIVAKTELVIVPVTPSPIDIHATAKFIKDLLIFGKVRARKVNVAVVANRVRSSMPTYEPFERFLASLGLPLLSRVQDSDTYLAAVEDGIGVFEMDSERSMPERQEFLPIIKWIDSHFAPAAPVTNPKIVNLGVLRRLNAS